MSLNAGMDMLLGVAGHSRRDAGERGGNMDKATIIDLQTNANEYAAELEVTLGH